MPRSWRTCGRDPRDLGSSALTDMVAHTRHLEAAYLRAIALRAPEALTRVENQAGPY